MHADKAPGYDGLNPGFYQAYWNVIQADVVRFFQDFFATGQMQKDFNRTLVCLIPKVKNPQQISELRPISLCNVLFRIFSKVLANRLKECLPSLISANQSAFYRESVVNRQCIDCFRNQSLY